MADRSPARGPSLAFFVKLAISVALLVLLFSRADAPALTARFRQMNARWAFAALAAYAAMVGVSVWRWRVLLRVQTVDVGLGKLVESFLVATFFNNFLPSNIGGDVVRIADTAPYAGSKTVATTVVLVDRLLGLVALFLVTGAAGWLAVRRGLDLPGAHWLWVPLAAALALLGPALRTPRAVVRLAAPIERWGGEWARERLARLVAALERFGREPRALFRTTLGAIAVQTLLVAFFLCTAWSLAIPLPIVTAACIVPISLAAQMLPLSINGFGVREGVFAFFFTRLGLGLTPALSLSLAGAGLVMLASLPGGGLLLLRHVRGGVPGDHLGPRAA